MARATTKTSKRTRVTAKHIAEHRASSKRDNSPRWDDCDKMTTEEFNRHWKYAMEYYRLEFNAKDLKPKVIDWMGKVGYDKDKISAFKKTKDNRCNSTMGGLAACLLRGMPEVRADFNHGRNSGDWLRNAIQNAIDEGTDDIDEDAVNSAKEKVKVEVYVPSIQDRLREASGNMTEEIETAIDQWITDPESFDPKAFKVASLLRGKGVKAAHARLIKNFYTPSQNELLELASGADEQLREAYSHVSRKNVRKLMEFYQSIMDACDQIGAEAKLNKKPRAKKVKPAEDLVKKLKFCKTDDSLGIVSVPPVQIIGSKEIWIYNTKTRKLGKYVANDFQELSVKGTSIVNFNESTSVQKTVRKPAEQLKAFKDLNTQKRMQTWFEKDVKTTDIKLNGRFNEDIVILKVYK